MDYQAQIDKWKVFNKEEARTLFKVDASEISWKFQTIKTDNRPDLVDINKYYDHYNVQTPLIRVSFLSDTKLIGDVLDKTWVDLNPGNSNNFIRSLTIEDSGFKSLKLQLIDRTFQTVQARIQKAIEKGSGNVIKDNYNNSKIEKHEEELQEGDIVTLDVLREPQGVTNNIRINYGWAVDGGEVGNGYFQSLAKRGLWGAGETNSKWRWTARTYASYDPLIRNDGDAYRSAQASEKNAAEESNNLSSQKVLTEYNLQTTAWNGWEEFYITDVQSTLTDTGIIYDITATSSDNMKLSGYKFVQMFAEITAKPKEILTCLMNNFNGKKDALENGKIEKPFYLLWVDKTLPEIQEEKRILLMKDGKPYDPSAILEEKEKEEADAAAQYGSMSDTDIESYISDSKIRVANLTTRVSVLKKALGCLTNSSGGEGDDIYDKGDTESVVKKFPGLQKSNIKFTDTSSDNIKGQSAAYYYMASITKGLLNNVGFYKRCCFFKYLENNLRNLKSDEADFNGFVDDLNYPLNNKNVAAISTSSNTWGMKNIYKALPVAFFDDIYDPTEYNEAEKIINSSFGERYTQDIMSDSMMTVLDSFVDILKNSRTTMTISYNGSQGTTENVFAVPLNLALLLLPTNQNMTYVRKGKVQGINEEIIIGTGDIPLPNSKITSIDNTSARTQIVSFFDRIVKWITGYKKNKKSEIEFDGLFNPDIQGGNDARAVFGSGASLISLVSTVLQGGKDEKIEEIRKTVESKYNSVFDNFKIFGSKITGKEQDSVFFIALCLLSIVSEINGMNGTVPGFQDGGSMKANHLETLKEFKNLLSRIFTINNNNPLVFTNGYTIYDKNCLGQNKDLSSHWPDMPGESFDYNGYLAEYRDINISVGGYNNWGQNTMIENSPFIESYKKRCEFIGKYGAYSSENSDDWSGESLEVQLKNIIAKLPNGEGKHLELDFMDKDEDMPKPSLGISNRTYGSDPVTYYKSYTDSISGDNKGYFEKIFDLPAQATTPPPPASAGDAARRYWESQNKLKDIEDAREFYAVEITKAIKKLTQNIQNLSKTIATMEAGSIQNQITLSLGTVDSVGKVKYKSVASLLNEFCSQCKPYHDYEAEVNNKNKQRNATNAEAAEVETLAKYVDAEGNEQVADMQAEAPTYPLSWDVVGYVKGKPLVGLFYKRPFKFSKIRKYSWGTGNRDATTVKSLSISTTSEFAMLSSAQRTTVKFDDSGRLIGLLKKGYGSPCTPEETSAVMETYINSSDLSANGKGGLLVRSTATEEDLKKINTVMLQAVNKGSITVLGDPSLRFSGSVSPYTLPIYIDVSLQNQGQIWGDRNSLGTKSTLSGIYTVGKITHNINSSGYTTTLEVMRYPGINKTVLGSE